MEATNIGNLRINRVLTIRIIKKIDIVESKQIGALVGLTNFTCPTNQKHTNTFYQHVDLLH